jgi:fibronectin type 3 domain-containing protein
MQAKHPTIAAVVLSFVLAVGWHFHASGKQGSSASSQGHRVVLKWDKTRGAASYNIYRRSYLETAFTKLGSSATESYADTVVQAEVRYCYQVTSVDSKSRESAPSPEFCVTVPKE